MLNFKPLRVNDQISFGMIEGRWTVAGETGDGRYVLVIRSIPRTYQVIDRELGFRGALSGGPLVDPHALDGPGGPEVFTDDRWGRWILEALEDGRGLALSSLMPLWIDRYWTDEVRGPVLDPEKLSRSARLRVWHWLQDNGCRWLVGPDERVCIKGQHIEVTTWTIREPDQGRTLWPRSVRKGARSIPTVRRRFRIRVPLSTIRRA